MPSFAFARGILGLLAAAVICAQTPTRPEFEVASVKPSPPGAINTVNAGVHIDGQQVRCNTLSIHDYLGIAYRVKNYQISGPVWMASERFDIVATLPAGSTRGAIPDMLQALLETRFQMKFHRESKDLPVYGLIVGKNGVKMQEAPPDPPSSENPNAPRGNLNIAASGNANAVTIQYGQGSSFTFANNRIEGKKLNMTSLADTLARFADRPVVDLTNLQAQYDFGLDLAPEDYRAMMIRSAIAAGVTLPPQVLQYAESASLDSLFNSVEKLGLKLEPRKAPVEMLVIDHIEKTPTEN